MIYQIEFTCCICHDKFNQHDMDTEERICYPCLNKGEKNERQR